MSIGVVLVLAGTANARPPAPGARFVTDAHDERAVLQVAENGRSVVSAGIPFSPTWFDYFGSYATTTASCGQAQYDVTLKFGAPGFTRIAISRLGNFHGVATVSTSSNPADTGAAAINGRFRGASAILRIRRGTLNPAREGGSCPLRPQVFKLHERRVPAYRGCARTPRPALLRTRLGRIYRSWGEDEGGRSPYAYGCLSGGRQIALGRAGDDNTYGTIGEFRMAGAFVSWVEDVHIEFSSDSYSLAVADLRGFGRGVRSVYPVPDSNTLYDTRFSATLLTPTGSSAWIATYCLDVRCAQNGRDVWVADAAGVRRVDRDAAIVPESLTRTGATVTWLAGSERRSASIG